MKAKWESIKLQYVGHVSEVLQGGGGKLSLICSDTGDEPRKPKGQVGKDDCA